MKTHRQITKDELALLVEDCGTRDTLLLLAEVLHERACRLHGTGNLRLCQLTEKCAIRLSQAAQEYTETI